MDIYDLHCDLLCYLANDASRSAYDPEVRCAIPQLQAGGVKTLVLPIFTSTAPRSVSSGLAQLEVFRTLSDKYPIFNSEISTALAIENCSSFFEEDEPLQAGFDRLAKLGPLVYASLTWNGENRFGGGAGSEKGLKPDGEELLRFFSGKGVWIDFSHTSDRLAHDILALIDKEELQLSVLASHSNFRAVHGVVRNLPDELASEIFRRGGVIAINLVKMFIGPTPDFFIKQIEHGLELGGEDALCLGADFFYGMDVPADQRKPPEVYWFDEFDNASTYPVLFNLLKSHFSEEFLIKLAHRNFRSKLSLVHV